MHLRTQKSQSRTLSLKLGVFISVAIGSSAPLAALSSVVEGTASRSDQIEQRVSFADLELKTQSSQLILISRVKKAAGKICNKIYRGHAPMMKFQSGCTSDVYRKAKPQIDLAIANADSGMRVTINLTAKRRN